MDPLDVPDISNLFKSAVTEWSALGLAEFAIITTPVPNSIVPGVGVLEAEIVILLDTVPVVS